MSCHRIVQEVVALTIAFAVGSIDACKGKVSSGGI